jgi:hypothetical protein
LSDPQSLNAYSYGRNNPINKTDPKGLWFGEFLTGRQSYSSFQMELGQAAMYLNPTWQKAMDHPYIAGTAVGVAGGLAAAGGSAVLAAASNAWFGGAGTACLAMCGQAGSNVEQSFQAVGKAGEAASGLIKNTSRIPSLSETASYRIPDGLDKANKVLSEVKNVNSLSYTNQLKDFASFAKKSYF